MAGIDARLYPVINTQHYDIQMDANGDIATEDFFDTAILVSLYGERRADASEVALSQMRRGWIGNESTPGKEIGSKIWLYEQSRITRTVLLGIADAARECLEWLVEDGYAISIDNVVAVPYGVDGIRLEIAITRPNSKVEKRFYDFWDSTKLDSPVIDLNAIPLLTSVQFNDSTNAMSVIPSITGFSTEWTFAIWVKRMDLVGSGERVFFSATPTSAGVSNWIVLNKKGALQTSEKLGIKVTQDNGSGTKDWEVDNIMSVGDWRFIAITFDGSLAAVDELDLYIDGAVPGVITKTNDLETSMLDTARGIAIGDSTSGLNTGLATFRCHQAMIWKKKLTEATLSALYNSGNPKLVDPNQAFAGYDDVADLLYWFKPGQNPANMGKNYAESAYPNMTNFNGIAPGDIVNDFPGI
jgi:phage gp46-like protein